ncbi:MAG: hypothetical protein RJQ04_03305 [Longimicrobiales bacterium]
MWICLNDAFVSIVEDPNDDSSLLVRARRFDDLVRALRVKPWDIDVTPDQEYPYRVMLPRPRVQNAVYRAVGDIAYSSLQASVSQDDTGRLRFHDAVAAVIRDFAQGEPIHESVERPAHLRGVTIWSDQDYVLPPMAREPATRDSWPTRKDMLQPRPVSYEDEFTPAQWGVIERGYLPRVMEERWFVWVGADAVHMHRGWTGNELYRAYYEPLGQGARIVSADYEGASERYRAGHPTHERDMIRWLLRGLLLGQRSVPYPTRRERPAPRPLPDGE